jgi:effector-binding domain-containing protein
MTRPSSFALALIAALAWPAAGGAQAPAPQPDVMPPATTLPAPSAPVTPPAPVPPPTAEAVDPDATLAGKPGDPNDVDTLVLAAKPALIASGQTTWDQAYDVLREVFRRLATDATRLGLKVAGRPLTYFVETDDMGFRYEAMLPVDRAPAAGQTLGAVRAGQTPTGAALRFMHRGPYDDIDATYEGITAYLDAKGLTVRDQFIEEYLNEPRDAADPTFEINIYVQPR